MEKFFRRIDDLGRIVIPKDLRRELKVYEGERMKISITGDKKILIEKEEQVYIATIQFKNKINGESNTMVLKTISFSHDDAIEKAEQYCNKLKNDKKDYDYLLTRVVSLDEISNL